MNKVFFLAILNMFLIDASAQEIEWTHIGEFFPKAVKIDPQQNIFTVGVFSGTEDFDPSDQELIKRSRGFNDVYIQKLNDSGELLWVKTLGGINDDEVTSISVNQNGDLYLCARIKGTAQFDSVVIQSTENRHNEVLIKLDSEGNLLWERSFGDQYYSYVTKIVNNQEGDLLLTGAFEDFVYFDPSDQSTQFRLRSKGSEDVFIAKLNSSGEFVWVKSVGGDNDDDVGLSIASDQKSNIYISGYHFGDVDFDPGPEEFILGRVFGGSKDPFLLKLNKDGEFLWAHTFGSRGTLERGTDVKADKDGNVYMVGNFEYTVDFDPDPVDEFNLSASRGIGEEFPDYFVQKFDSTGDFLWARRFGSKRTDEAESITIDPEGNVIITGQMQLTVDFDPGPEEFELRSAGWFDVFIQKLNPDGNFLWSYILGGDNSDYAYGVDSDMLGNVVLVGKNRSSSDSIDFNPLDPSKGPKTTREGGFHQKVSDDFVLGASHRKDISSVVIFPNPSKSYMHVHLEKASDLNILNYQGILISKIEYDDSLERIIDLSEFESGVYFLEVRSRETGSIKIERFLIE